MSVSKPSRVPLDPGYYKYSKEDRFLKNNDQHRKINGSLQKL